MIVLNKTISILGCGWLGLPLAVNLIPDGWKVKGSTTRADKLAILSANHIEPFLVQLNDGESNIPASFLDNEMLIINIPPGLGRQSVSDYISQMTGLLQVICALEVKQVIFISSTSVYPDKNWIVTDAAQADNDSALYQSEQLFYSSRDFTTTIIRFAGLIGPGRHPSRFFAGKTEIPNGDAPVNLIHLDDCICIIETILKNQCFGGVYHAAAPEHPARKEFYSLAARHSGLAQPQFRSELTNWKIIDTARLINDLGYQFKHPSLLRWLEEAN